jgi:hypothetical protein
MMAVTEDASPIRRAYLTFHQTVCYIFLFPTRAAIVSMRIGKQEARAFYRSEESKHHG